MAQLLCAVCFLFIGLASCKNQPSSALHEPPILAMDTIPRSTKDTVTDVSTKDWSTDTTFQFKYDVSIPDQTLILSRELMEISGLSTYTEENTLITINDEKGILYTIELENGEIIDEEKFGKKGDYEGVEMVGDSLIYIVKSNGTLVEHSLKAKDSKKFNTLLSATNDVEGLGCDPINKTLLLACKGSPYLKGTKGNKKQEIKAIYGWDIEQKELIEEPILMITDSSLTHYLSKLENTPAAQRKYTQRLKKFAPSGIAFHPEENVFYLVSSVGKLLVVVDRQSIVQHIEFLDDVYFAQPEGICFGKNDELYISNEGRGLVPKLMRFDRKP